MLTGGNDPLYRQTLAVSHQPYIRVDVHAGDGTLLNTILLEGQRGQPEGGSVVLAGSVDATLNSQVSRNISLTIPASLYPRLPSDLFSPTGNEIRAYRGILFADESSPYVWPVFRGRIQLPRADSTGRCTVRAADRAQDVIDVGFVSPQNSQPGQALYNQWQQLIIDAVPNATFGTSDILAKPMVPLTWSFDRGSALDEMARSVGALWYCLADGSYVIRRFPWTQPQSPVITLTDQTGGTVQGWARQRPRDAIYNVVTVTGERLNGDTPVYATASDTTLGSPTSINGNFGVRSRLERLQSPATQGGALSSAQALLSTYVSPIEEWTLEIVPDAALELGDVVRLRVDGDDVLQVVVGFTMPMDLSGSMIVQTRSLVVGGGT